MLPLRVRLSLLAVQLVALATLLRSIAFDRWITVLASVLLIVGAVAAQRGRASGVALAFGAAVAFPVAWLIGIAPAWFALVGVVGALPFALTSPAFARFDKGATALLAFLAASTGALGAIAWKEFAWTIISAFPSLRPTAYPHHGFVLAMVVAVAALATRARLRAGEENVRVRVGERVRVAEPTDLEYELATDVEEHSVAERRRAQR